MNPGTTTGEFSSHSPLGSRTQKKALLSKGGNRKPENTESRHKQNKEAVQRHTNNEWTNRPKVSKAKKGPLGTKFQKIGKTTRRRSMPQKAERY